MKPFLAIDCGAASLKVALFEPQASGSLVLARYEIVSLGQRGLEETDRVGLLKEVLQDTLDRHEIRAKGLEVHVCTPSYQSFTKFLRTPPVEGNVFAMTGEERQAKGIRPLPGSLGEAIVLAEESELLREALGEHILNSVIQNKNMEWAEYRATVTDYETARYLPIL